MWSFFSRDPSKDFAYEIGEKVPGLEQKSSWNLHEGKHKTSGAIVSVFTFDVKGSSESQVQLAAASFKRLKTLRHPNILGYIDGLETEKVLYIVTEYVVTLETYLNNNKTECSEQVISWGLHQLAKGLSFLNNDCKLIHNNVCLSSVFVDQAGEWRLGGVDYMYQVSGSNTFPTVKILPALEKYDPPEKAAGGRKPSHPWSSDMWGLGCLIWEVFNGQLPRTTSLKSLGQIPKSLVSSYCELVGANPKSRPNPANFIEGCRHRGGFMDNKFVDTMLFLEEIQIKDGSEKVQFFNSLPPVLDSFPPAFCKHKILPQLLHAFEYGNAGSAVLMPLFKVGKYLDSGQYQAKIVPCIVKMFSSTDRATRVKLLQQMEHFVEHLSADIVNTRIYPSVTQGFMDSNPVVREHTIKSMLYLASKLNYKNLNEDLLKHFARLQSKDDQGGIRTNTTVCLGKVAGYLNPQVRQKVLTSAYLRAVKDPFPPARQAGVLAMAATHNLFSLQESACRLLPTLCSLTMDPDKAVRDQVFKAIRCFVGKLEKVSETPELMAEMEKDVLSGGSAIGTSSSWAGWAVSGMSSLTSKIYKGRPQGSAPQKSPVKSPNQQTPRSLVKKPAELPAAGSKPELKKQQQQQPQMLAHEAEGVELEEEEEEAEEEAEGWGDADGWDDEDWGDMEDTSSINQQDNKPKDECWQAAETAGADDGGWDVEDSGWDSLEEPVQSHTEQSASAERRGGPAWSMASPDFSPVADTQSTSSYDWGQSAEKQEDFFSDMLVADKKKSRPGPSLSQSHTKPASQPAKSASSTNRSTNPASGQSVKSSSAVSSSAVSSGWTDTGWGEESWQDMGDNWGGSSKTDPAKQKRLERQKQRQQQLGEKRAARAASAGGGSGAMKLGGKKLAKD